MHILIVNNGVIPAILYGGTERVTWYLGRELVRLGHRVSYLVRQGSHCGFAAVHIIDPARPLCDQIPEGVDVVHFNSDPPERPIRQPYIITIHGNANDLREFDRNAVFVSRDHAVRFGSTSYVHNGLDWDDYGQPALGNPRRYFHFLGNAAWRIKNVKGAIRTTLGVPGARLAVMGGSRLNIKMGFRLTLNPRIRFYGMVGGERKLSLLQGSRGLVFPVRWHEPFGLALTESLYFGCPVFGTPYGSLPEIVIPEVGFLSTRSQELSEAMKNVDSYSRARCHEYARDLFGSQTMALAYLEKYTAVLNGGTLNPVPPQLKALPQERFLEWHD